MKGKLLLIGIIIFFVIGRVEAQSAADSVDANFPYKSMPEIFPGTKLLTYKRDISAQMLDGAHKFIEQKIDESINNRSKLWNRNFNSQKAYELSIEPNRKRFMKYIGVEDKSLPAVNYNVGLPDENPQVYMQRIVFAKE